MTTHDHRARSPKPIDQRAERILASALDEFARRGFRAANETGIARRAGVSLTTLRRYFASKAELFRETVRTAIVTAISAGEPGTARAAVAGPHSLRPVAERFLRAMDDPASSALLRLSLTELPRFPELATFYQTEVLAPTMVRLEGAVGGPGRGRRAGARVILAALITHAHWLAAPTEFAGILGPDPGAARQDAIDVLVAKFAPEEAR